PLEQIPVDLRPGAPLAPSHGRVAVVAVAEHFKADELVDIPRSQRCLVELYAELLHADVRVIVHGDAPNGRPAASDWLSGTGRYAPKSRDCIPAARRRERTPAGPVHRAASSRGVLMC